MSDQTLVQWCEIHAPTIDEPIKCCPCCEAVNERNKVTELTNALNRLMKAVQLHILVGMPEINTVEDVVIAMRVMAGKLNKASGIT